MSAPPLAVPISSTAAAETFNLARAVIDAAAHLDARTPEIRTLLRRARFLLQGQPAQVLRPRLAPWQLRRVTDHVETHLAETLRVSDLARQARLSASYFSRAFKDTVGITAKAYVQTRRVERAKHLLGETEIGLAHIAQACGFADQAHFSRTFRELTGLPPQRWRLASAARPLN